MAMTLETKLREIFASAVTAAGCVGYATSVNERNNHKEAVANARKRFEDEIAHLSAQAKVQLPDDVEEVTTSLGDDAAYLRMQNDGESEIADNMERASNMIESLVNRLSQGAQGDPFDRAAAEVLEQERMGVVDAAHESALVQARSGIQLVSIDDAYPPETIPDDWSDKPFARIQWTQEDGDPSVGMHGWAGWTLAADQKGTMIGALAEFCRTDPDNWERFNDLYNQTHKVP